ncbi:hypothetical protein DB30_04363 [Enhygromyxa salina]|uniref:Uncharacterized protein n=1 Tax=Enhygromyxa salina TaxID=215803 RepID=A0A0C2D9C7_9BACT|nr:hypothetical protein DB30_04363 [Enhygromyxa salina]
MILALWSTGRRVAPASGGVGGRLVQLGAQRSQAGEKPRLS